MTTGVVADPLSILGIVSSLIVLLLLTQFYRAARKKKGMKVVVAAFYIGAILTLFLGSYLWEFGHVAGANLIGCTATPTINGPSLVFNLPDGSTFVSNSYTYFTCPDGVDVGFAAVFVSWAPFVITLFVVAVLVWLRWKTPALRMSVTWNLLAGFFSLVMVAAIYAYFVAAQGQPIFQIVGVK